MFVRHLVVVATAAALVLTGCDTAATPGTSSDQSSPTTGDGPTTDGPPTIEPAATEASGNADAATSSVEPVGPDPRDPATLVAAKVEAEAAAEAAAAAEESASARAERDVAAREAAKEDARTRAERLAERAGNTSVQERLAELGYYDGAIDGIIGSGSTAAVRAFQQANTLTVDGVIGPQTRTALRGDAITAEQAREAAERQADEREAEEREADQREAEDADEGSDSGSDAGDSAVLAMGESQAQDRLRELGYWGGSTWSALMAFQKVNGLTADGQLGPNTAAALADPRTPSLAGGPGTRVEVDLDRQVVHWISGGTRVRTMNASSGNGETFHVDGVGGVEALTPIGTFVIERRISGLREGALGGMYDPMYFFHGWALHGSNSVPAHPASHGCVRLSRADASWLFGQAPNGTTVTIHGSRNAFVPGGPDQPPIL